LSPFGGGEETGTFGKGILRKMQGNLGTPKLSAERTRKVKGKFSYPEGEKKGARGRKGKGKGGILS